jgi:hypothetical protein
MSSADDRYNRSENGLARHRRYNVSAQGRLRAWRYNRSGKGIARRIRAEEYSAGDMRRRNLEAMLEEREAYEASGSSLPFHEWLDECDPLPKLSGDL